MSVRVLVVEDDDSVAGALVDVLRLNGYAARRVSTGTAAVEMTGSGWPDLVLLDVGLPDGDGLRVCATIRQSSSVPIIVVSAQGDERRKVEGLRAGADDYVTKPFGSRELMARVEAVLRRTPPLEAAPEVWLLEPDTLLDVGAHQLCASGRTCELTSKELGLLVALVHAGGQVVLREVLGATVWRDSWVEDSRTLDVHVAGLRTKLGDRKAIQTVRGVGFRLNTNARRQS